MKQEHLEKLPVDENDFTAVEAWLEQMAGRGYFLDETAWSWWYFKECDPGKMRYRLDAVTEADGKPDFQKLEDYEAAGWFYVTTHGGLYHIFKAEDQATEELHTDPIVKDMRLEDYEKRIKNNVITAIVALSSYFFLLSKTLRRNMGYPAMFTVNSEFPMYIFFSILVIIVFVRRYRSFRTFHRMRSELRMGKNVLPSPAGPEKRKYERAISYGEVLLVFLCVVSMFRSCGGGGPVEQQLRYGDVFPALEFLEDEAVKPVDGDETGDVFYYSSPFLKEHYEVTERGKAGGKIAELEAEFFDVRLTALAAKLNEELKEMAKKEYPGAVYEAIPVEGFDEYLVAEQDGGQLLHARIGTKILRLSYRGGEDLSSKAGLFEKIMNAQRPD